MRIFDVVFAEVYGKKGIEENIIYLFFSFSFDTCGARLILDRIRSHKIQNMIKNKSRNNPDSNKSQLISILILFIIFVIINFQDVPDNVGERHYPTPKNAQFSSQTFIPNTTEMTPVSELESTSSSIEQFINNQTTVEPQLSDEVNNLTKQDLSQTTISHSDIPFYFQQKMQQEKPVIFEKIKNFSENIFNEYLELTNDIKPWNTLNPNIPAEKTLLPYIHIPKTAGSDFRQKITKFKFYNNFQNWSYQTSLYPRMGEIKSFNSPGCKPSVVKSGTHCTFQETDECIRNDFGAINVTNFGDMEEYFEWEKLDSGRTAVEYKKDKNGRPKILNWMPIKNFQQIKYWSIIRSPITRILSEYYFWRHPEMIEKKTFKFSKWTDPMNRNCDTLENWLAAPEQTAFNRQIKSFYPGQSKDSPDPLGFRAGNPGKCTALDGKRDWWYMSTPNLYRHDRASSSWSSEKLSPSDKLNDNFQVLVDTIKNIENNFLFIGILEDFENSVKIMKILFLHSKPEEISFDINREKRNVHSSGSSERNYSIKVLDQIFDKNLLDMLLWDYLSQKLKITVQYFGKL